VCCGFLFVGVLFFCFFGCFWWGLCVSFFCFVRFCFLWGLIVRCECLFVEAGFCLNDFVRVCLCLVVFVCVCWMVFVLPVFVLYVCWF